MSINEDYQMINRKNDKFLTVQLYIHYELICLFSDLSKDFFAMICQNITVYTA